MIRFAITAICVLLMLVLDFSFAFLIDSIPSAVYPQKPGAVVVMLVICFICTCLGTLCAIPLGWYFGKMVADYLVEEGG